MVCTKQNATEHGDEKTSAQMSTGFKCDLSASIYMQCHLHMINTEKSDPLA